MIPGLLGPVVWQNGHLHRYSTLQFTGHLPTHLYIPRLHPKRHICPSHSRDLCFGFLCNPQTFSLRSAVNFSPVSPFIPFGCCFEARYHFVTQIKVDFLIILP